MIRGMTRFDGGQGLGADVISHEDPVSYGIERNHGHADHIGDGTAEKEPGGRHFFKHPVVSARCFREF